MLSFDLLIRDCDDIEMTQLRILSELKAAQRAFNDNSLYPHLKQLVAFRNELEKCQESKSRITENFKKRAEAVGFDFESGEIERADATDDLRSVIDNLNQLIAWALPLLTEKADEGKTIFDFIRNQLELKWVGIMPSYQEEGYLIVPSMHRGKKKLFILTYKLSVITSPARNYRTAKITDIRLEDDLVIPSAIKRQLRESHPEKPNPATLFVDTGDMPQDTFPFGSTIFPVCQYMLAKKLA